jgi:uncharacterized protein YbaP (TraB family)
LKRFCIAIYALIILSLITIPHLQAASPPGSNGKLCLWQVNSKSSTVYLFGSIHAVKKEMYPLDRTIEDAFEKSDVLAVEVDVTGVKEVQIARAFQQAGMYEGNESLEDDISKETRKDLEKYLVARGMTIQQVRKNKPWFLNLSIVAGEIMRHGYDPKYGIDRYFMEKAKGGKPIMELETIGEQVKVLSGGTKKEEDRLMRMTLKDLPEVPALIEQMVDAWKEGDADGLIQMELERNDNYAGLEAFANRIFYNRNVKMARKIKSYLKTDKTYFVVVGALHIGGNRGILQYLKRGGYSVKQLSRSSTVKSSLNYRQLNNMGDTIRYR